jgi:hypothetical protein
MDCRIGREMYWQDRMVCRIGRVDELRGNSDDADMMQAR